MYQLQFTECPIRYVGQTGRTFEIRYKEHIRDIKNNEPNSKYAQHILGTTHEYWTIQKIMKPLYIGKKGPLLEKYEKFHIYEITKQTLQLNDNFTDIHNPTYDEITTTYKTCGNSYPYFIRYNLTVPSPL
jgi:hypothetical protein